MGTDEQSVHKGKQNRPADPCKPELTSRRAAVLEAVALSAEAMVGTGSDEPDLMPLLSRLGTATGADTSYIFQNQTDTRGTILTRRRYLWTGDPDQASPENASIWDFLVLDVGLRRWSDAMRGGETLMGTVSEFPLHEQRLLVSHGIQSILLLPIFLSDGWWGFLGLDSRATVFQWSSGEIDVLKSVASLIGAALDNARAKEEFRSRAQQLGILHNVSRTVGGTLAQDRVLQLTLGHIRQLFEATTTTAYVADVAEGEALQRATAGEFSSENAAPDRIRLRDSVTGQVIITGRPVFLEGTAQQAHDTGSVGRGGYLAEQVQSELGSYPVADAQDDPSEHSAAKSAAFVPLVVGEHVLGTLNLAFDRARRFTADERWLLSAIGQQAGIALANARLFQETVAAEREARRRADQLAALHEIDRAINSTLEPAAVYARIVEHASGLLNCQQADLLLIGENPVDAVSAAQYPTPQSTDAPQTWSLSIDQSPFLKEMQSSQTPVVIADSALDARFGISLRNGQPVRAIVGLPLISRAKTIGFLLLADQDHPRQWQQDEISIAAQVADQAAVAIANARLFANEQKTRQTAETLREIARIVNASLDLNQTLRLLLEQLAKLVPYDSAALFLHQNHRLRGAAGLGFPDLDAVLGLDINVDDNPLFKSVVQSKQHVLLRDAQKDERFQAWASTGYARGWLCVPLLMGTELVGLLTVDSRKPGMYDDESARLANALANHTAVAIYKARLLDDLQRANRELRELDELKGQFVQNVAHELRTPLALVRGHVELLAAGDLDTAVQDTAAKTALKHTHTLVNLVESITTIQDLNIGQLEIKAVDPAELVDTAIQLAHQKAVRAGVRVLKDSPVDIPVIPGDFNVLSQALYQLVDNAIKFSSVGNAVTLRLSMDPRLCELEIAVEDQGIGIPPEEQDRIFDLFYQADGTTTRRFGGTGLGLAIVQRAVRLHNGRVWVESPALTQNDDHGMGSRFVIRLPRGSA